MCDALKPSLHCDEELHIKFCGYLCHCSLWCRHFFDARWSWTQGCL